MLSTATALDGMISRCRLLARPRDAGAATDGVDATIAVFIA
jgi:hypothetical protein